MLQTRKIKRIFGPYFSKNNFILVMHQNSEITCITLNHTTYLQNIDYINSKIATKFGGDENTIVNHLYLLQYIYGIYSIEITNCRLLIKNPSYNTIVKIDIPKYQPSHSEFKTLFVDNITIGLHILKDQLLYTCNYLFGVPYIPISKTQYNQLQRINKKRNLKNIDLYSHPIDTQLVDSLHNFVTKLDMHTRSQLHIH